MQNKEGVLKICFVGAMSTGKSMLAERVYPEVLSMHPRVGFIKEIARKMIRSGVGEPGSESLQKSLCLAQISEETLHSKVGFVADRSVIDIAAWGWTMPQVYGVCRTWMDITGYTHIFYVPIVNEIAYECDDVRPGLEEMREAEDVMIRHILKSWKVKYHAINSVELTDRVKEVCNKVLTESLHVQGINMEIPVGVEAKFSGVGN